MIPKGQKHLYHLKNLTSFKPVQNYNVCNIVYDTDAYIHAPEVDLPNSSYHLDIHAN